MSNTSMDLVDLGDVELVENISFPKFNFPSSTNSDEAGNTARSEAVPRKSSTRSTRRSKRRKTDLSLSTSEHIPCTSSDDEVTFKMPQSVNLRKRDRGNISRTVMRSSARIAARYAEDKDHNLMDTSIEENLPNQMDLDVEQLKDNITPREKTPASVRRRRKGLRESSVLTYMMKTKKTRKGQGRFFTNWIPSEDAASSSDDPVESPSGFQDEELIKVSGTLMKRRSLEKSAVTNTSSELPKPIGNFFSNSIHYEDPNTSSVAQMESACDLPNERKIQGTYTPKEDGNKELPVPETRDELPNETANKEENGSGLVSRKKRRRTRTFDLPDGGSPHVKKPEIVETSEMEAPRNVQTTVLPESTLVSRDTQPRLLPTDKNMSAIEKTATPAPKLQCLVAPFKPIDRKLNEKPAASHIPRLTKPPNFAKLHEKEFKRMDSIDDHVRKQKERKEASAKKVTTFSGLTSNMKTGNQGCVKMPMVANGRPRFVPTVTAVSRLNFNFGKTAKENGSPHLRFTGSRALTFRSPLRAKESNRQKAAKNIIQKAPVVSRRDQINKQKDMLEGVRTNRRFELLMKHRMRK